MFDLRVPESMANLPGRKVCDVMMVEDMQERTCKACGKTYSIDDFPAQVRGERIYYRWVCKHCHHKKIWASAVKRRAKV